MGYGLTPGQVQALRTSTADACGRRSKTSCLTTLLALRMGWNLDPAITAAKEQIAWWLQSWSSMSTTERMMTRKAWHNLWQRLQVPHRWRLVKGPMGATICVLLQYGWRAPAPDTWMQPEVLGPDGWWHFGGGDIRDILEAIADSVGPAFGRPLPPLIMARGLMTSQT